MNTQTIIPIITSQRQNNLPSFLQGYALHASKKIHKKQSLPERGSVADTTVEGAGFPATVDSVMGMAELVRIPFTWTGTVDPGS